MKSKPSYRTIICLSAQCIVFCGFYRRFQRSSSLPICLFPFLDSGHHVNHLNCKPLQVCSVLFNRAPSQLHHCSALYQSLLLPCSMQCTQGHSGHQRTLHQPLDIDRIRKDQIDHLASHLNRYFHQCDLRSTGLATVQSSLGAAARAITITSSHSPNAGELRDKIIILPHKNGEQFSVTNLGTIPTFSRFSNGECPLSLSTTKESTT